MHHFQFMHINMSPSISSDIVGWTPMSETVPTHQLIEMLNQLFAEFDTLTEKHGVFKADTIGDACKPGYEHDFDAELQVIPHSQFCIIPSRTPDIVAAGHEGQAGPHDATLRVVVSVLDYACLSFTLL